jgi:hypothetical protein
MGVQALRELGLRQVSLYALYRLGLRTGYFRLATPGHRAVRTGTFHEFLKLPERSELQAILGQQGQRRLVDEAEEIVYSQVRLFGGVPVPLELTTGDLPAATGLKHWTAYERNKEGEDRQDRARPGTADVKILWEPARFGWACALGRAYRLTGDERYPAAFWRQAESFLNANPPYLGPHWVSSQEAALRLIAFAFALHVFHGSEHLTPGRVDRLSRAIADHACRIPPTLVYARAQNNNHLLSEAAGLYTAGVTLPDHPSAKQWRSMGWEWFHRGVRSQVAPDGVYLQQSTNYHRLMLQLSSWMACLAESQGQPFLDETMERLAAATRWLLRLLDPLSGRVPNLGPNDGAYVLPLAADSYDDYRPVLQTAAGFFLRERPFREGLWDEMGLWFRCIDREERPPRFPKLIKPGVGGMPDQTPHVLHCPGQDSWAYLRVARFESRPGHADQLHLDLWWRGLNLAQDAGTYRYNAPPPWDNALTSCQVHNTVSVDGRDQMKRSGRFLYLDWAQAKVDVSASHYQEEAGCWSRLSAWHDGYRCLGVIHRRSVEALPDGNWLVLDSLLPSRYSVTRQSGKKSPDGWSTGRQRFDRHLACVQWLLPDWRFEVEDGGSEEGTSIRVLSPHGWVRLVFSSEYQSESDFELPRLQIVRAGELVHGSGEVSTVWGWSSPTYNHKLPALCVRFSVNGVLPFTISSQWIFPPMEGR